MRKRRIRDQQWIPSRVLHMLLRLYLQCLTTNNVIMCVTDKTSTMDLRLGHNQHLRCKKKRRPSTWRLVSGLLLINNQMGPAILRSNRTQGFGTTGKTQLAKDLQAHHVGHAFTALGSLTPMSSELHVANVARLSCSCALGCCGVLNPSLAFHPDYASRHEKFRQQASTGCDCLPKAKRAISLALLFALWRVLLVLCVLRD